MSLPVTELIPRRVDHRPCVFPLEGGGSPGDWSRWHRQYILATFLSRRALGGPLRPGAWEGHACRG